MDSWVVDRAWILLWSGDFPCFYWRWLVCMAEFCIYW